MEKRKSLQNWCWENWTAIFKRMRLEYFLIPHTTINSKWIKEVNVRPETIKLLEENIGKTLFDINHSNIFWSLFSKAKEIKAKINKWDLIKLKNFSKQRKLSTKRKDNLLNGRKYLQMV